MPGVSELPSVNSLIENIVSELPPQISKDDAADLRALLHEHLGKALLEGEFYRRLNHEMISGLQDIYQQIHQAKEPDAGILDKNESEQLFNEASKQLDEIMTTTEEAASHILNIIERQQDMAPENAELLRLASERRLNREEVARLFELNDLVDEDLTDILTALSFQDLTGQRIKKIVATLKTIESKAFELVMSTGLAMKAHAKEPGKDMETIQTEAKRKASELKGPTLDANQKNVDDLLAELGL